MEKPAVVFNEAGFKMFLDLVRDLAMSNGGKQPVDNDGLFDKADADDLVKAYFARTDKPDIHAEHVDKKYDMEAIASLVAGHLTNNYPETATTEDIGKLLRSHGYEYELRAITPVMSGVMKRHPEIERIDAGVYGARI